MSVLPETFGTGENEVRVGVTASRKSTSKTSRRRLRNICTIAADSIELGRLVSGGTVRSPEYVVERCREAAEKE